MSTGYEVPISAQNRKKKSGSVASNVSSRKHSKQQAENEDYEEIELGISPNLMYAAKKAMVKWSAELQPQNEGRERKIPPPPTTAVPQPSKDDSVKTWFRDYRKTEENNPYEDILYKLHEPKSTLPEIGGSSKKMIIAGIFLLCGVVLLAIVLVLIKLASKNEDLLSNSTTPKPFDHGDHALLSVSDRTAKYSSIFLAYAGPESTVVFHKEGIDLWVPRNGSLVRVGKCKVHVRPKIEVAILADPDIIVYSSFEKGPTLVVYNLRLCEELLEMDVVWPILLIRGAGNTIVVRCSTSYINTASYKIFMWNGKNLNELTFSFGDYRGTPSIAANGFVAFWRNQTSLAIFDSAKNRTFDLKVPDDYHYEPEFARNGSVVILDSFEHYELYNISSSALLCKGENMDEGMKLIAVAEDGRSLFYISLNRECSNCTQIVRLDSSLTEFQFTANFTVPLMEISSVCFRKINGVDHLQAFTKGTAFLKLWRIDEAQKMWIPL